MNEAGLDDSGRQDSSAGASRGDAAVGWPTLASFLAARAPSQASERVAEDSRLLLALARALEPSHAGGLMRPGLSPKSIRVGPAGEMSLTLAPMMPPSPSEPGPAFQAALADAILKAPHHLAPECARIERDKIDERADVFTFGSIACEILTGEPAFRGSATDRVRMMSARNEVRDAHRRVAASNASEGVKEVILACLEADPGKRIADASELVGRLERALAEPVPEPQPASAEETEPRAETAARGMSGGVGSRERALLILGGILLALVSSAVVGGAIHWRQSRLGLANLALQETTSRIASASAHPLEATADLDAARQALENARDAIRNVPLNESTQNRITEAEALLVKASDIATRERDLLAKLEQARAMPIGDDGGDEPGIVLRSAGLDADKLDPAEFTRGVLTHVLPVRLAVLGLLDEWALQPDPNAVKGDRQARHRRLAAGNALDPEPGRVRIRKAIDNEDKAELRQVSLDPALLNQAPETFLVLSSGLASLGETAMATDVLNLGLSRHPNDFWLNTAIVELVGQPLFLARGSKRTRSAIHPQQASQIVRTIEPFARVALASRPEFTPTRLRLAMLVALSGRFDEALLILREGLRRAPDDFDTLRATGELLALRGRTSEAAEVLGKAAGKRPDDALTQSNLGVVMLLGGQEDAGFKALREGVRLDAKSSLALSNLGAAHLSRGHYEEAENAYRKALELDPAMVGNHLTLGAIREARGDVDGAIAAFRKGASLQRGNLEVRRNLAELLARHGHLKEALAEYDELAKTAPLPAELAATRASVARLVELDARLAEVVREGGKGVAPEDLFSYARLLANRGFHEASARAFADALKASPGKADDLVAAFRYEAARSAARAATSTVGDLAPAERDRWRKQSLEWLKADLALRAQKLREPNQSMFINTMRALSIWKLDPALAPFRDDGPLAQLQPGEREAWKALWSEVDVLLRPPKRG